MLPTIFGNITTNRKKGSGIRTLRYSAFVSGMEIRYSRCSSSRM